LNLLTYLIPVCGIALLQTILSAAPFDPQLDLHREISAYTIEEDMTIDGRLEENWYESDPVKSLIQIEPDNGELASETTHIWIGYTANALVLGARMFDENPEEIIARIGRRDASPGGDALQFAIDTYHDGRNGFAFVVTAAGSILDGKLKNDEDFDESWNGIWESAVHIDASGWTVEMLIPFSQLRFNTLNNHIWGVQVVREIARKNERAALTWYPRGETGNVSRFATLTGLENIQQPSRREFLPYLTGSYSHLPSETYNVVQGSFRNQQSLGMDVKLGLGSSLTLDAAINPDFGQVEVDPAQINLSAFETIYSEKRPFFVEGNDIYAFGEGGPQMDSYTPFRVPKLFYSRRIGQPPSLSLSPSEDSTIYPQETTILGAVKLSGKVNKDWSIGGLSSVTAEESAEVMDSTGRVIQEVVEPLTYFNLVRFSREYGFGRGGIGVLGSKVHRKLSAGNLETAHNRDAFSLGLDGWAWLDEQHTWGTSLAVGITSVSGSPDRMLKVQSNSSHNFHREGMPHVSIDSSLTMLSGNYSRFLLSRVRGKIGFTLERITISPGFDSNDFGITGETDRIFHRITTGYKHFEPGHIFRYFMTNLTGWYLTNYNGTLLSNFMGAFFHGQFNNYISTTAFAGIGPETKSDQTLWGGPLVVSPAGYYSFFNLSSNNQRDVVFGVNLNYGGNTEGARERSVGMDITYKLGDRLHFSFSPNYSTDLKIAQYHPFEDQDSVWHEWGVSQLDQKIFRSSIRMNYTISPFMSVQTYIQPFIWQGKYSDFKTFTDYSKYEFTSYPKEAYYSTYHSFIFNSVYRWEFQPGSVIYFVWTRSISGYPASNSFNIGSRIADIVLEEADNHFAVKLTYWID